MAAQADETKIKGQKIEKTNIPIQVQFCEEVQDLLKTKIKASKVGSQFAT
eukprot:gene16481-22647_t